MYYISAGQTSLLQVKKAEEGWFGQPKYSTFLKKVILRCIGLCFHYHHLYLLSRLDQPLIQRIPAGLSSTVACLDITYL